MRQITGIKQSKEYVDCQLMTYGRMLFLLLFIFVAGAVRTDTNSINFIHTHKNIRMATSSLWIEGVRVHSLTFVHNMYVICYGVVCSVYVV